MSSKIQIYYFIPSQLNKGLSLIGFDLHNSLSEGNKTSQEIINEIRLEPEFCRDELGIDQKYLTSSVNSDIVLYAVIDDKIVGLLTYMFTVRNGKKIIVFNGICSPAKYSGLGVGKELILTLIKIGKVNNVNYINLDCKGDGLMDYYKKFGFKVVSSDNSNDSDDEDDEIYYKMTLDLSGFTSGGKKKTKKYLKKKRNTRRKLRKYR
jgi:GNAT superfamily N-acetyltransferase